LISILLAAVAAGLAAGLLRAGIAGRPFSPPDLRGVWLAPTGFLLQVAALQIGLPDERISAALLVGSLLTLLIFAWRNRRYAAFYWLGGGLLLNLAVMALNGGWMPISPETLARVYTDLPAGAVELGSRVGDSKNVALAAADTRLEWLADRFLLPERLPFRIAYSVGDVLIAIGAFWLLWQCGGAQAAAAEDGRKAVR
jgi:hypothetical protein